MPKFARFVEHSVVVLQKDLAKFLRKNWRGLDTKDYELLVALLICRIFEKDQGKKFHIALPVNQVLENQYSYETVENAIREHLLESTPVDFFLVDEQGLEKALEGQSKFKRPRAQGGAMQIKRIAIKSRGDITDEISTYLSSIVSKYPPLEAALVLVIGEYISYNLWNLSTIYKRLYNLRSVFPFSSVFIVGISPSQIIFGEIWPSVRIEEYKYKTILGDVGDRNQVLKYVSQLKLFLKDFFQWYLP